MIHKLCIRSDTLNNIDCMELVDIDDNGIRYTKSVSYLAKSVRLSLDTLVKLQSCSKGAYSMYIVLLHKLCKDTNVVTISNKELKEIIGCSDSVISRSKDELKEAKLIEISEDNKYTYIIPIDKAYKGNLNKMIQKYKEYKAEEERIAKEEQEKENINLLSNKRKFNFKHKTNGSKN